MRARRAEESAPPQARVRYAAVNYSRSTNSCRQYHEPGPAPPDLSVYIVCMPRKRKSPKLARVISSKTVFSGRVFRVDSDEVIEPGGVRVRRDVVRHPGSVVIAALNQGGSAREPLLLLERQYRYSAGARLWELPAGRIDPGEDDLAAAKRELLEETGFTARTWKRILRFYPSPGFLDELMHVFVARGLSGGTARPEDDERITVRFFSVNLAVQMAFSGRIVDGKTLATLLWLQKKLHGKFAALP